MPIVLYLCIAEVSTEAVRLDRLASNAAIAVTIAVYNDAVFTVFSAARHHVGTECKNNVHIKQIKTFGERKEPARMDPLSRHTNQSYQNV